MSIEAAIADHAAAIRELAEAIRATVKGGALVKLAACVEEVKPAAATAAKKADAELEAAVTKVGAEAKPTTAKAAVQAALAAAAEKAAPVETTEKAAPVEVAEELAAGPLSYEKDVQPLLLQVGKNRDQLVELLRKFGAKNGAGIKDSDYPAVVAEAKAIIAARG